MRSSTRLSTCGSSESGTSCVCVCLCLCVCVCERERARFLGSRERDGGGAWDETLAMKQEET